MQVWYPFYAVMAGAAATLLGLLFVAVSVSGGDEFARAHSVTRALAEQAFQHYLAVLLLSSIILLPDVSSPTIGAIALSVASSAVAWSVSRLVQAIRHGATDRRRLSTFRRHATSMAGLGLVLLAALRLCAGRGESFHMFAAGVLTLLVSSATISWELLLRLVQARSNSA